MLTDGFGTKTTRAMREAADLREPLRVETESIGCMQRAAYGPLEIGDLRQITESFHRRIVAKEPSEPVTIVI